MQINCLHPQIVINPLAKDLISEYGNYTLRGHFVQLYQYRNLLYDAKIRNLNPHYLGITSDDVSNCYITDCNTGNTFPLYMEVPCGKCDCCKKAKVDAFVHRCKLETMYYDCKPIFLTLTYNEENKKESGVNLRDVQLFFKRLRINLYRKGYRQRIRFVLVSEYGKHGSHRPHYHAILWNLHATDFISFREINQIIEKSWCNGFILSRFIEPSDDKAFFYTAKYLRKDMDVPRGCNKPFCISSNRSGGIGAPFIRLLSTHIRKRFDINPQFCNKFSNRTENLQLNRYVLNKLFPTFSSSLPKGLKKDVRDFLISCKILKDIYHEKEFYFQKKAKEISDFFGSYFYCPQLDSTEIKSEMVGSKAFHLRTCIFAEKRIERAMSLGKSFYSNARALSDKRDYFLSKLFQYEHPIKDLHHRAYEFRRSCALAKQREVL